MNARLHALHHHAAPHLARAGSSAMVLPPKAFRPALPLCTIRCAAGEAMNGARTAEHATISAAALARAEPQDETLCAARRAVESDGQSAQQSTTTPGGSTSMTLSVSYFGSCQFSFFFPSFSSWTWVEVGRAASGAVGFAGSCG